MALAPLQATAQPSPPATAISVDAARDLIFVLLQSGNPAAAADAAQAVLTAQPGDVPAWLGLSQAHLMMGQATPAARAGRKAWAAAKTPNDRYASAMVTARALSADNRKTLAQLWLRRAYQVAPNASAKRTAAISLRQLRANTPLHVRLDFGIEPTNNINGGARSEQVHGGTISGTSLALSGVEYSAAARLTYSLPPSGRTSHALTFAGITRHYTLSDEAQATAPNASGSDFAFQEVELGWRTRYALPKAQVGHTISFGKSWSGGDPLSNFRGLTLDWSRALSPRQGLSLRYEYEIQDRLDADIRSSTLNALSATWTARARQGVFSATARLADKASDSATIDYDAASLSLSYAPREAWIGTNTRLTAFFETRDYPQPIFFGQRTDDTRALTLDITFGDINYYGFAPTVEISARRTESTVDLYDADTLSVGFGLTSLF
ncbi:MAG: surface lipoprotein assembly modifier [Pseudomonadota bacterium]